MNKDHASALVDIARHQKGLVACEAKMTAVDRFGFHLRLTTPERVRSVRSVFPSELRDPEECRQVLVAMAARASSESAPEP